MFVNPEYLYCWWTEGCHPRGLEVVPGQPEGDYRLMRYKPNWTEVEKANA